MKMTDHLEFRENWKFCAAGCDCIATATVLPLPNLCWSVATPTALDCPAHQTSSCAAGHWSSAATDYPTPAFETRGCEAVNGANAANAGNAESAVNEANATVSPRRAPVTSIH